MNSIKSRCGVYKTNNCGNLFIIEYVRYNEVRVKFINTGYETTTTMGQILDGRVKDRMLPTVCGVGIVGDEPTRVCNKPLKDYDLWQGVLKRCYDNKLHVKYPTYKGCTVSNNFKYYPYFKEWCQNQIGFESKDEIGNSFALDKDILVKGNKMYSENTCVFIPMEINKLLVKHESRRGGSFIGTYPLRKKFIARLTRCGENFYLGVFETEMEAFYAYKEAKEAYIKELANKWKDQIDPRAYDALMDYQIEITD